MAYISPKTRRKCKWDKLRCYGPTFLLAVVLGVLLSYLMVLGQEQSHNQVELRQYFDGFLVAFFMGPVLIGLIRGLRRHRRHLTRPTFYGRLV